MHERHLKAGAIDRRDFLALSSGAFLVASSRLARAGAPSADQAAKLEIVLDRIFKAQLAQEPQTMTSLGVDVGAGAWARSRLDDQSVAHIERMIRLQRSWLADLETIDRAALTGIPASSYDCVAYDIDRSLHAMQTFRFGRTEFPQPYVLSQLGGSYQSIPGFLDTQHVIADRADAEAYLARLRAFAQAMNEETARARADASAGIVPPDFVIDRALMQMQTLRSTPLPRSTLVTSLAQRASAKEIEGDWAGRASAIVSDEVWGALDRQIALLRDWRPRASHDAGIWRLPDGEAFYRFATRFQTTTTMSPAEIHDLGRHLVDEISAAADASFKAHGLSQGSVPERYTALFKDPRFIYPNTDAGKAELIDYLNERVRAVTAKLPAYFGAVPKTRLEVRRVPPPNEAGAPGGNYQDGSLDGSRPGIYFINLRNTAETPRWTLPTLTYHEGIPGHHLQGALVLETPGLPMIRRTLWFTAYGEGWALYAEQLADEMGMYADDPWGRLGYFQAALLRAVRLVIDSGLHDKRWSREQAIAYFMEHLGSPAAEATTEVERYCVWPGQACSYMIGKMTWLRLRSQAQARLGARYDIRKFHDAALLTGPMPLETLERHLTDWMEQPT
jgi:uncharacterized protein (DUF885 family)